MDIGMMIRDFIKDLTQDLINILTSPDNIKKYDTIIQSSLDVVVNSKNRDQYIAFIQQIISLFISPNNIESYKQAYSEIFSTGIITAPKAGEYDEKVKQQIQDTGIDSHPPIPSKWSVNT